MVFPLPYQVSAGSRLALVTEPDVPVSDIRLFGFWLLVAACAEDVSVSWEVRGDTLKSDFVCWAMLLKNLPLRWS